VAQLADGSLLVSDDYAGAIYRISYEGALNR
jgi:glucose/arabinose dehydrogenase